MRAWGIFYHLCEEPGCPILDQDPRRYSARGTKVYDKPPLTLDDLADRLQERGLIIPDRIRALRYLRHIGYFRLSPYTIAFQRRRFDHLLQDGTEFDDVLNLYVFDRTLRLLVMDAIERVEVAVRAALTDHMSTTYGDPHWYVDSAHFRDAGKHGGLLRTAHSIVDRQLLAKAEVHPRDDGDGTQTGSPTLTHRSALEHYLTTYGSPELPPSWLMVETLTWAN